MSQMPLASAAEIPAADAPRPEPLLTTAERHLLGNYRQAPFVLDRGAGLEVFDTEGRRYLDFAAGVAVDALGHAHPKLVAAIAEQAGRLMHVSNYFYNAENVRLAGELCEKTGFDRAFFCNSGTEAIEAMMKFARRSFFIKGDKARVRFIAFHHSFHGRTMGAVSLTGTPKYHEGFAPMVPGVTHVAYGDIGALAREMGPDVAAILVEPVQGEGGVVPAPPGFLAALRKLCDDHGALLLFDEVQTGVGRTGKWLGGMHSGVAADAITLAKGLGGGFPIGAMLTREAFAGVLTPGTHGSTFGGNALASAAARAVIRVLDEEQLVEAARTMGDRLSAGLSALAAKWPNVVKPERGVGLLRGLPLADGMEARPVVAALAKRGLLVTVAGSNVLRFTPPLVVREAHIDEAMGITDEVLAELTPPRAADAARA